jgi:hypothetical protein
MFSRPAFDDRELAFFLALYVVGKANKMRDIVFQIRLNKREREKLGKLADYEQVGLAERIRLFIRETSLPNESKPSK